MKKLSKAQIAEHERLSAVLNERSDALGTVIHNGTPDQKAAAVEAFNDTIREADDWRLDILSQMEGYSEGKSERWQEGETGSNFAAWKESFEEAEIEAVHPDIEDDADLPDLEVFEVLPMSIDRCR